MVHDIIPNPNWVVQSPIYIYTDTLNNLGFLFIVHMFWSKWDHLAPSRSEDFQNDSEKVHLQKLCVNHNCRMRVIKSNLIG